MEPKLHAFALRAIKIVPNSRLVDVKAVRVQLGSLSAYGPFTGKRGARRACQKRKTDI